MQLKAEITKNAKIICNGKRRLQGPSYYCGIINVACMNRLRLSVFIIKHRQLQLARIVKYCKNRKFLLSINSHLIFNSYEILKILMLVYNLLLGIYNES